MPMLSFIQRRACIAGLLAGLLAPALAASPSAVIASRHLGAERAYQVQLPASYADSAGQRYPLLLVLDAQVHFAHVAANVAYLADQGEIPELIVVGLASGRRVHDYTQTDWPQQWVGGGGAAKFKRFVADELLPTLDGSLRTSGERLLFGHSAAGQFALHLLATESALFQGYLVLSPSLDWDGRLPLRELEAAFKARERLPGFLYVAEDGSLGGALTDQLALRQVLQQHAPRGLQSLVVAYAKETHGSVALPASVDALRAYYHGWRLHPDDAPVLAATASELKIDALGQRYAALARNGRTPVVPEAAYHAVAEAHFRRSETAAGVALLRRAVAAYPWSPDSREALSRALQRPDATPQAPASR